MAVTPDGALALLGDPMRSEIRVVDARSLELFDTIKIASDGAISAAEFSGSASPGGLVITPNSQYAYISLQGLNQVLALDLATLEEVGRFDTGAWPDGIGFSPLSASRD